MRRDIERYSADYLDNYGFEEVLVNYRRQIVLDQLMAAKPSVVLEIGCGAELLYQHYLRLSAAVESWLIVEPARAFCSMAREAALPGVAVIEGFLEGALPAVMAALPRAPDIVICSGVLQEVPSSKALLSAMRSVMDIQSLLHVNVANAGSFHRLLAVAMGLIQTLDTLSDRNVRMQQHRVYDFDSLSVELDRAGFTIQSKGGYLVKPFTHAQMESVAPLLGQEVMDGLFELGKLHPELACEIYANAKISA